MRVKNLAASDWMKVKETSHWLTQFFLGMIRLMLVHQPSMLGRLPSNFSCNDQLKKLPCHSIGYLCNLDGQNFSADVEPHNILIGCVQKNMIASN